MGDSHTDPLRNIYRESNPIQDTQTSPREKCCRELRIDDNCPVLTNKKLLLSVIQQLPDDVEISLGRRDNITLVVKSHLWPHGCPYCIDVHLTQEVKVE